MRQPAEPGGVHSDKHSCRRSTPTKRTTTFPKLQLLSRIIIFLELQRFGRELYLISCMDTLYPARLILDWYILLPSDSRCTWRLTRSLWNLTTSDCVFCTFKQIRLCDRHEGQSSANSTGPSAGLRHGHPNRHRDMLFTCTTHAKLPILAMMLTMLQDRITQP
jgi:hypothetical protein